MSSIPKDPSERAYAQGQMRKKQTTQGERYVCVYMCVCYENYKFFFYEFLVLF